VHPIYFGFENQAFPPKNDEKMGYGIRSNFLATSIIIQMPINGLFHFHKCWGQHLIIFDHQSIM